MRHTNTKHTRERETFNHTVNKLVFNYTVPLIKEKEEQ